MSQIDNGFNYKDGISLKEFFLFKLEAQNKALELQAREYERRLENLNNEARQLKEMQRTYLPRETWEAAFSNIAKDIRELRESRAELQGKASMQSVVGAYVIAGLGILVGIIGIFYK